ncbi:MAG TPA: polyprenyl diphosphate synthase [Patescibacteria group bacterium]|nr:polyprenyl diphosphate synthase [Patescibacteria group bacterium]
MTQAVPQLSPLPQHVAIIMDGNGRWATARGLSRTEGHKKGAEAAQRAVDAAREIGIPYITLFSFSSENWNRPPAEIEDLMNLLRYYLTKEMSEMKKNGARLMVIGDRTRLPADIVDLIRNIEDDTKANTRITVVIALSYGGRQDIVFAARELARQAKADVVDIEKIDEDFFSRYLMTRGIPDPDLMIRTSGESRISNFLMWQLAYAELFFTNTLWPDFSRKDMEEAVAFFNGRDRRYGGLSRKAGE